MKHILILHSLTRLHCDHTFAAGKIPLKVFILAGESNKEKQAHCTPSDENH
jgi:hypothetical protein